MSIRELYRKIQVTGEKEAGAAKILLHALLKRGAEGFPYPSLADARRHADVRILLDLGLAVWKDLKIFAGNRIGGKVKINPDLAQKLKFSPSQKTPVKHFTGWRKSARGRR